MFYPIGILFICTVYLTFSNHLTSTSIKESSDNMFPWLLHFISLFTGLPYCQYALEVSPAETSSKYLSLIFCSWFSWRSCRDAVNCIHKEKRSILLMLTLIRFRGIFTSKLKISVCLSPNHIYDRTYHLFKIFSLSPNRVYDKTHHLRDYPMFTHIFIKLYTYDNVIYQNIVFIMMVMWCENLIFSRETYACMDELRSLQFLQMRKERELVSPILTCTHAACTNRFRSSAIFKINKGIRNLL